MWVFRHGLCIKEAAPTTGKSLQPTPLTLHQFSVPLIVCPCTQYALPPALLNIAKAGIQAGTRVSFLGENGVTRNGTVTAIVAGEVGHTRCFRLQ